MSPARQHQTTTRSPSSANRPSPLYIPDSPLKRFSQLGLERKPDDPDQRWSIPIFFDANDDCDPSSISPTWATDDTPRQAVNFPADVFASPLDGCSTPRGSWPAHERPASLAPVGPWTPQRDQTPAADPDLSVSSGSDQSTWSAPSVRVFQDRVEGCAIAHDDVPLSRRNRLACGPEDDIWRQCDFLRPKYDFDDVLDDEEEGDESAAGGLFDPNYDLRRPGPSTLLSRVRRGSSPFGSRRLDDDDDEESEVLLPDGDTRAAASSRWRCPSPLDSTHQAILSRLPSHPDRALLHSNLAARPAPKGELRVIIWMEHDDGRLFHASLGFRRYCPPTHLDSSAASPKTRDMNRFAHTGSIEYAPSSDGSLSTWRVQAHACFAGALTLTKITLSDDDELNFISAPASQIVTLGEMKKFKVGDANDSSPRWVLECEVSVEASDTIVNVLSFRCDPDLLDRSRVAKPVKVRGKGFRLRLGSASDASSRGLLAPNTTTSSSRRRFFSADESPPGVGLKMRFTASETHLLLPSASSLPLSPNTSTPSSPSSLGLFRKRSLSAARPPSSSSPIHTSPRRSHSLRTSTCSGSPSPSSLGAPHKRNVVNRSSAPLPFVPSSIGSGQDSPRVRSSPGQGLPASVFASTPPSPPPTRASMIRRSTSGSAMRGAFPPSHGTVAGGCEHNIF